VNNCSALTLHPYDNGESGGAAAGAAPLTDHLLPLQGRVSDLRDLPLPGGELSVRIWDAATGGQLVYDSGSDFDGVEIVGGSDDSGGTVASGVYFFRLDAPSFTATRRMVLIK